MKNNYNENTNNNFDNISDDLITSSLANNKPYSFIFKIILIGDSNCGKTSLINRYVKKQFSENYICTIGVDFMMKNIIVNSELIKLQIWDTAGMEKYKQITTSYYRGAQAALICFDLTNKASFQSLERWIQDYVKHSNSIFKKIIYIIGNKSDLVNEREVTQEEIDTFIKANDYPYYECSSKSGNNIDLLFNQMTNYLYGHYRKSKDENIKSAITAKRSTVNIDEKYYNLLKHENKKCNC